MAVKWIILTTMVYILPGAQTMTENNKDDELSKGMLIFAYVCFGVGAILIIAGFARLIWWAWAAKKNKPMHRRYPNPANPNFYTYYKDPWLRAPSMASLASVSRPKTATRDVDADSLRVDTDAIYSQPADANPHGLYIHSAPSTEQELSQTESQIYADAGNGNGNNRGNGAHELHSNIYSVPQKFNMRGIPVTSIDEEDDVIDLAPALPMRAYNSGDVVSLTEADRSSMREIGYVEPPADYSPSHQQLSTMSAGGFSMISRSRDSVTTAQAHSSMSGDDPFRPNELSGEDLFHTAVFRNSSGTEVNRFKVAPGGSVKSMKSLYKYMETEEPCALDNEINYTFVSSVH